jgi:hypothetical protein
LSAIKREADLAGWKAIGAYLGRSVRSVQRWERDLGLPVRRVRTRTSEVVFARREDIDAWFATRSANIPPKEEQGDTPANGPSPWQKHRARVVAVSVLTAAAGILAVGSSLIARRAAEPARWAVESGVFVVRDIRGGFLWAHRFDQPVDPAIARYDAEKIRLNRPPSVTFADLEGDGSTEVLAALGRDFHCFESDGRLRFRHAVRRTVRFGDESYGPEFAALGSVVVSYDGRTSIWAAFVDNYFPAVLRRLDSRGRALGEYWMAGHPTVLRGLELGGKRVLAIGGTANESHRASLSILDPESLPATAPATVEKYRCRDCPASRPLAYLTFPRTELSLISGERETVLDIVSSTEGLRVVLASALQAEERGLCGGDTHYTLDSRFRPASAEVGDVYRLCHAKLRAKGLLDHDFGPRDEAELFPVQAWYRGVEEQIGAATAAPGAPARD